jgi:multidrug efflux pump subunit AcrA (membrane-fusion protein)
VVVGDYQGEKDIVIMAGLQGGERVIVDGALRVVAGQPVKLAEPKAAEPEKKK